MKERDVIELIKKIEKIEKFTPPQEKSLENSKVFEKSLVVSAPTASGKTLIGKLALLYEILVNKKKGLYVVPLKSLANEKYKDFKNKYEKIGIKVEISTGDYDSPSEYLKNYDLIILTIEKLDSLIRHKASWLKDVGVIVFDEAHMIADPNRGPTLEMLITRLKREKRFYFR